MKARILKAVVSNGKKLTPGTTVDVTGWRNAKTLVSGRYIEFLDETAEEAKPVAKVTPVVEKAPVVEETTPTVVATAPAKPKSPAKINNR